MQNVECAIVIPQRSPYRDVIEIISKYHLRRTLGLNDGDVVEVMISL
jgi:riboflavin kinase